jgi:carboxypeptidase C (cathepsin A)
MSTKKEKRFLKLKKKFDDRTLSQAELESLNESKGMEYCRAVLTERYKTPITSDCYHCMMVATYRVPRRTISDEQLSALLENEKLKTKTIK